jgi:hypothetical protein
MSAKEQPPSYRVKGTTLRAYLKYLKEQSQLDGIRTRVSPESAKVMADPPLPGSWVDARVLQEMVEAVYQTRGGEEAVLVMGRAVTREMLPGFVGVLQGVLKIFGASPAFIFPRLNDLLRPIVQGQDYRYTAGAERNGTMDVSYATKQPAPYSAFVSSMLAVELVFHLCGVKGRCGRPEVTGPQSARFSVSW